MTPQRPTERGAALITALLLLTVLGTLTTLMVERSQVLRNATTDEASERQAFWAAEGGLARTRHLLGRQPSHAGEQLRIGGCEVATVVTRPAENPQRWQVAVTATRTNHGQRPVVCQIVAELEATAGIPAILAWREL